MELESGSLIIRKGRAFVEARRVEKSRALGLHLAFYSRAKDHIVVELTCNGHFRGPDIARGRRLNLEFLIADMMAADRMRYNRMRGRGAGSPTAWIGERVSMEDSVAQYFQLKRLFNEILQPC